MPNRRSLALLLVLAAVLTHLGMHGWTIDSMLPHGKEPDAALVRQSLMLRGEASWSDHAWSKYPHLLPALMAAVPRAAEVSVDASATPAEELDAHLAFAARHLIASRWIIVGFAGLALPLTYLLARRLLCPAWSVVAVLFVLTSLLMQNFAHQARPHAAMMFPVLAITLSAEAWARRGGTRDLILLASSSALAVATLHNGAFFLLCPLIALVQRWRSGSRPKWPAFACMFIALAVAVRLAYPFLFDAPEAGDDFESGYGSYKFPHLVTLERFGGGGFGILGRSMWSYDPVLSVVSALGLAWLASSFFAKRRAPRESDDGARLSILFGPILLYLVVLGFYERTYERFAIPAVPFLAVAASFGLSRFRASLSTRVGTGAARTIGTLTTSALLILAAWPCLRLAWLHSLPDTYEEAAKWVLEESAKEPRRVLMSANENLPLIIPIVRNQADDPEASKLKLHWYKYLASVPDGSFHHPPINVLPLATGGRLPMDAEAFPKERKQAKQLIRDLRGHYIVTEQSSPIHGPVRALQERSGMLVGRFSPWGAEDTTKDSFKYAETDFRRGVLRAERMGPVLEVWTLRPRHSE